MTFVIDYSLDDGDTITREEIPDAISAERRARYLSKKHYKGGYEGPLVYVFHKYAASGQLLFFAGRSVSIEGDYLSVRSLL